MLVDIVYDWQTLIAGILALGAAVWTVKEIRRQIDLQERQISADQKRFSDTQQRKALGARAAMPDALSAISQYTANCLRYVSGDLAEIPATPDSAISAIKGTIEYVTSDVVEELVQLVIFYQVHNSRLLHFEPDEQSNQKADRLYDSVKLRWFSDRLFYYARNEERPLNRGSVQDQMLSALRNCVGFNKYFDDEAKWQLVVEKIKHQHPEE